MTAKEKLEELIHEIHNDGRNYSGSKTEDDFIEKYNVVHQHKCCAYCRFGVADYDGCCSCVHPERIHRDDNGVLEDIELNTFITDVCNAYEERTLENEDIDYGE